MDLGSPVCLWPHRRVPSRHLCSPLGAAGGLLNAVLTRDLRLCPTFLSRPGRRRRLLRLGVTGNGTVAAAASLLCAWALAGSLSGEGSRSPVPATAIVASLCVGFAAARLTTAEVDTRLLHHAVCQATAAPAAPPETVRTIAASAPWRVYTTTVDLHPPPLRSRLA